jgi:serine/threonine-protein kinase
MTAPDRSVRGEVVAGRYELEELVGTGGMSSVYKARDRLLERHVALKLLHPHYGGDDEHVERFRREARAVAQLSHPHIVTVIDRGEDDGQQYIVFELVDGENLKQLVERSGPLPVRRAVELTLQIADALAFAHGHGLVHRDVKPQNVLLTPDGDAKVTDFGIARSLEVEHGVTQTGTVLGTSNYISPEQAGGKPTTPATDVYSLGVVLYELLTGEVPFQGENFVAVAMKHVNEPPPDLLEKRPDVTMRLAAAVDCALAKDPLERFGSMEQFAWELRQCLSELGTADAERTFVARRPAPPPHSPPRRLRSPRRRRRRWLVPAVATLVVAAGIVSAILSVGGSGPGRSTGVSSPGARIPLSGVATVDPAGDGEHDDEVANAADGDPATYWETQSYYDGGGSLGKPGVGVVLDAGRSVAARTLTVTSDTPGFTAEIRAGASPTGPFAADSSSREVGSRTTFALSGRSARYYLVWITNLGAHQSVHVNEVAARS